MRSGMLSRLGWMRDLLGALARCVATLTRVSGALRLRGLLNLVYEQPWQAQEVVRGAAEDEDPVDLGEAAQLHLAHRSGCLEPAEGLLHKPSAAERAGISRVPGCSPVDAGAASLLVLLHMHGDVQLACRGDEVLGVIGLVRAHRDPLGAALLPLMEHQQRGIRSA